MEPSMVDDVYSAFIENLDIQEQFWSAVNSAIVEASYTLDEVPNSAVGDVVVRIGQAATLGDLSHSHTIIHR